MGDWIAAIDAIARETMLFAAIGLIVGGIDDVLVDLVYLAILARRGPRDRLTLATLPAPVVPGRIAVFVAAWDEAAVIGRMLETAVARFAGADYRIYVGVYPNDPATIDAVLAVAADAPQVRMVVGPRPGPTTKADCLNALWRAMRRDEARDGTPMKAVVLHDAEDVVDAAELAVIDALIDRYAVVQVPVVPLVAPGSRLVSGHYADEFAEAHVKQMVVRGALGASMPLAGTGCGIATAMLARIADERGGAPFDATSLTEDYELGLRISELGGRARFARVASDAHGGIVAVRAYFPSSIPAAVRQKARWMTGIALAGWDRTGWARWWQVGDHWMRIRDRRAPIAILVLAVAYLASLAWGLRLALHWLAGTPPPVDRDAAWLLVATTGLLLWRLAMRAACTWRCYGAREALWAVPRFFVGNIVSLVAAPRALARYVGMLRGRAVVWDKTGHVFPDLPA